MISSCEYVKMIKMRTEADNSPILHWTTLHNWNFSKLKPLLVKSYVRMQSHVVWYTGSSKTSVLTYQTMHCHVSDRGHRCDIISFHSLQLLCCTHQSGNKLAVTHIICYTWQLTLRLVRIKMRTKLHNPSCTESVTRWNDQRFHKSWKGMQCNIYIYRIFCLISKFLIAWMLIS